MDIRDIFPDEVLSRTSLPKGERAPDMVAGRYRLHDNPMVGIMIYEDEYWIDTALSWGAAFEMIADLPYELD